MKNILKNNRYYTLKHHLEIHIRKCQSIFREGLEFNNKKRKKEKKKGIMLPWERLYTAH
jgi:hypothetical protein